MGVNIIMLATIFKNLKRKKEYLFLIEAFKTLEVYLVISSTT